MTRGRRAEIALSTASPTAAAVDVVDLLEPVDVHEEDAESRAGGRRDSRRPRCSATSVRLARPVSLVVVGEVGQALLEGAPAGDVLDEHA